jgi:hypothetical protein
MRHGGHPIAQRQDTAHRAGWLPPTGPSVSVGNPGPRKIHRTCYHPPTIAIVAVRFPTTCRRLAFSYSVPSSTASVIGACTILSPLLRHTSRCLGCVDLTETDACMHTVRLCYQSVCAEKVRVCATPYRFRRGGGEISALRSIALEPSWAMLIRDSGMSG